MTGTEEVDGVAFPAVQMKLGFGAPTGPTKLHLALAGLTVLTDATDGRWDEAWQHLNAVGVRARPHEGGGLAFGVGELSRAASMPDLVKVRTDRALEPLWRLACSPPEDESVAHLEMLGGSLRLRWAAADGVHDLECPPESHAALLTGEVPFVASSEAWMTLRANTPLPAIAGRASLHTDHYIELSTAKPQLIEGAPLPALFKLADSRYGVPIAYWERVRATGGILWDGPTPRRHNEDDVMDVIDWQGGAILSGTAGERDAALDMIVEHGEHEPVLIITPPWSLWRWRVNDGWIRSYEDVADYGAPGDASLIFFDDVDIAAKCGIDVEATLRRLDGVRGAIRLAGVRTQPAADVSSELVGAAVRPAEFLAGEPIVLRYPGRGVERLGEHLEPYCVAAGDVAAPASAAARVRRVEIGANAALAMARSRVSGDPRKMWEQVDGALAAVGGAWFAGALAAVGGHPGQRIVVCCHDKVLASGIAAALRPRRVSVVDEDDTGGQLSDCTVLRYSSRLPEPDHRMWERFDVVVVCGSLVGLGSLRDHVEFGRSVEVILGAGTPDEARARYAAEVGDSRRLRDDELGEEIIADAVWPDPRGVEDGW